MKIFENETLKIDLNGNFNFLIITFKGKNLCYSVNAVNDLFEIIEVVNKAVKLYYVECVIYISENKNVYGYGGDLGYFYNCILNNKRRELKIYAYQCVEIVYNNSNGFGTGVPTCTIVQGKAYGGGFEGALSTNFLLSTATSKFSFPEVNFGSFPGMGAFSILTKKMGLSLAKSFINDFEIYSGTDLKKMNLVSDIIEFDAIEEVFPRIVALLKNYKSNAFDQNYLSLSRDELIRGVDYWVDKMMNLSEYNKNKISRIYSMQAKIRVNALMDHSL